MNMKLANALAERSNLQQRLSELEKRLNNNAKVQAGEEPAEDPKTLLKEYDEDLAALQALIARINLANSATRADGVTLTEMLAERDCLKLKLKAMRGFLDNASAKVDRYTKSEIAIRSTVSVKELQKELDDCSKKLRLLDEKIQELNWTTEI
jgi:uncharacterized coiled-coil protein SlyX